MRPEWAKGYYRQGMAFRLLEVICENYRFSYPSVGEHLIHGLFFALVRITLALLKPFSRLWIWIHRTLTSRKLSGNPLCKLILR
jgi:hypothetical protein